MKKISLNSQFISIGFFLRISYEKKYFLIIHFLDKMPIFENKNSIPSIIKYKWKGLLIILGGCLVHLVLGSFYLWGNINIYVTSYYRIHSNNSLTTTITSALFCLMLLGISVGFFFGLPLSKKIGFRLASAIETFLIAFSIFLSSYMENFWLFVLFYGICFGLLSGLLYIVPIFLACQYFPKSKGIITGIITGAFGLATIFSSLIAQEKMNPENLSASIKEGSDKYFDGEVADNLPGFIRYLSLYFFLLGVTGALLFFDPPKEYSDKKDDLSPTLNRPFNTRDNNTVNEKSVWEIIKSKKVYHIFLMNLFSSGLGLLIASNFKNYGLIKINDDKFLTIVGSVGAVFNGCGRMLWGMLYDRLTFKKVYIFLLIIQIIFVATFDSISSYKSAFFIWICVLLFCEGGHFAIFPALCLKEFGTNPGSKIYPVVYFAFSLSNFLQFGVVYSLKASIGYHNIYWIFLGLTVVSFILAIIFKERKAEENDILEFAKEKEDN